MNKAQLQDAILQGIPLSQGMAFQIDTLTANSIQVRGGAAQNINVHQTAFAGSLYCLCTLAVWGLVNSRLPDNADLVMAEAAIRYLKPVKGEIIAQAQIDDKSIDDFLETLDHKGKARLEAQATVDDGQQQAVVFTATLYARLK